MTGHLITRLKGRQGLSRCVLRQGIEFCIEAMKDTLAHCAVMILPMLFLKLLKDRVAAFYTGDIDQRLD